jgi:transcription-repair coupling factor (superfamily II helicase)
MQAVGYDLYCKLLEGAVRKAKGEAPKEEINITVNLLADAFLPDNYIVNEEQKLEIYKRIAAIDSTADAEDVREELLDRFGEIPLPAKNLLRVALIRSVAARLDINEISGSGGTLRIVPDPRAKGLKVENIPVLLKLYRGLLTFTAKGTPQFQLQYPMSGSTIRDEETLLQVTEDLLVNMSKLLR